jgi:UTP--glucose-1-phosphate uridylyltransferase
MSTHPWFDALDETLRNALSARGFSPARCAQWMDAARAGRTGDEKLTRRIEPIPLEAIPACAAPHSSEAKRLVALGEKALREGKVAVCVLAGGMATRMGGVVKALVEVAPNKTLLDWRIDELEAIGAQSGQTPPLWLMTSLATDAPLQAAIRDRHSTADVATFEQDAALRLTPEGHIWLDKQGAPSIYATGHGDLASALTRSGLLDDFIQRGGRSIWISNIDNIGAKVDPLVLGHHIDGGKPLTVELVDARAGDRGGRPVLLDKRPVIAEDFRFPEDVDPRSLPTFNTNTFLVDAQALAALDMSWTYFRVEKSVENTTVVQFERLMGEMTFGLEPAFLRVSRDGPQSRFRPLKTQADLDQLRESTCA